MAWRVPKGGPQVCDARRWPAPPCRASSGSPNRQPGVGCGTGAPARRTAQDDPLYDREIARSDRMGRVLGPHTDVDGIPRDHISGLLSGLVPGSPRTTGHERLSGDGHPAGATNSILATVKSHSAPRSSWHTTRSARGRRSAGGWIIRTSSLTGADPAARSRANTSAGSHGLASTVGASRAGRSRRVDAEHRCGRPEIVHQRRPGQGGDRPATTDPADQSPASRSGNRPVPPSSHANPPPAQPGHRRLHDRLRGVQQPGHQRHRRRLRCRYRLAHHDRVPIQLPQGSLKRPSRRTTQHASGSHRARSGRPVAGCRRGVSQRRLAIG